MCSCGGKTEGEYFKKEATRLFQNVTAADDGITISESPFFSISLPSRTILN